MIGLHVKGTVESPRIETISSSECDARGPSIRAVRVHFLRIHHHEHFSSFSTQHSATTSLGYGRLEPHRGLVVLRGVRLGCRLYYRRHVLLRKRWRSGLPGLPHWNGSHRSWQQSFGSYVLPKNQSKLLRHRGVRQRRRLSNAVPYCHREWVSFRYRACW